MSVISALPMHMRWLVKKEGKSMDDLFMGVIPLPGEYSLDIHAGVVGRSKMENVVAAELDEKEKEKGLVKQKPIKWILKVKA